MRKRGTYLPLMGTAVAFIWGLTFLSTKVAVRELGPMSLALARFVIAVITLIPIVALTKTSLRIDKRDILRLAAAGFLGITLYFLFENNGIMRLSASESSIIVGTIPVLTLLIEIFVYKRKTRPVVVAGIVLSFLGVAGIVAKSETVKSNPIGYLYMVGAALTWVAYTFLTKPLGSRYSLLCITFWQIFFGTLGCVPFAVAEGQNFAVVSLSVWLNVAFLGVLASALGYWFYVVVLDKLGPSRAAVFINLVPVVSIVASFFLLGERLSPLQLAGGAAAIAGVYLATA